MPFDALVAPAQPKLLSEVLADHGIAPVSLELLEATNGAARAVRPQLLVPPPARAAGGTARVGGLHGGHRRAGQRMMPDGSPVSGWMTLAWMCVIGLLIGAGVFRVRAGSHWEERWVPADWLNGLGVPEPIARLGREMTWKLPGSALVLGELKEEYVVLDPYLLLECDGEQVCLGIWDGEEIVAFAERYATL